MKPRALKTFVMGLAAFVLPGWLALGCAPEYGYTSVDGYDAAYVEPPPPEVVASPTYRFGGGYIYEGNGRYYHPYHGHWVTYRTLPHDAVRVRPEGRAMHQGR